MPVRRDSDGGHRPVTPFLFVIIAVAASDLVFAMVSIPAVFGLTRDPYLVFTANVFALLGLRQQGRPSGRFGREDRAPDTRSHIRDGQ